MLPALLCGSYSSLRSAPPAQTRIPLPDSTAGSQEPGRHRNHSDDIKAASLLSLKTKAPFAVSSVEAGGKQTLQRAPSTTGHRQHGRFSTALCTGLCKKALGLRLVSTLLALKAKHRQVLLKQQVESSPGMLKQGFLERKIPSPFIVPHVLDALLQA